MPSPLGHALGGLAAGWAVAGPADRPGRASLRPNLRRIVVFAVLGCLPDLDLLLPFSQHRTWTHSVAAVLVVLMVAAVVVRGRPALAVGAAAAYGSHLLLDFLGHDTSAPVGLMAFWPLSHDYVVSGLNLFPPISRRYWLVEQFLVANLRAAIIEVLVLGPLVVAALTLRGRTRQD